MNKTKSAAVIFLVGLSFNAQSAIIDFTSMADGSVSTIGDATFSLAGVGEAGVPSVSSSFGGGLWNSSDGAIYPTNTILRVDFSSAVSNLSWIFDNEGGKSTTFTIYDSAMGVLASGFNTTGVGFKNYDYSGLSDVKRIDWNNNGNNWLFALGSIEYDSVSVPEPTSVFILGLGLAGLGFSRRKRSYN